MLFQPAIIALLLASGVAVAMLAAAAPFAVQVIRQWDIASGSERQLALERRGGLVGQNHRRAVGQRAGDGDALLLATGELRDLRASPMGDVERGE